MIRLEPITSPPRWLGLVVPLASLACASVLIGILLWASGEDPLDTFSSLVTAGFTDPGAFSATLLSATPLAWTGLAVLVTFRLRVWNIGAEGQLVIGVLCAAAAGLLLGAQPPVVAIAGMIAAGMAGGMVWALIVGCTRAWFQANEVLTSLMLNYLALLLALYLIFDSRSYLRDTSTSQGLVFPQGKHLSENAEWPALELGGLRLPLGTLLALVAAVAIFVLLRRTTFGFRVRMIADAPVAGAYAGARPRRVLLVVTALSGALAGMGGAALIGDFSHVVDPTNLQQSAYGYTGIVVASLARLAPLGVPPSALALGALVSVGFQLQGPDFPLGLPGTMTGILLIVVVGGEVFSRYRLRWQRAPRRAEPVVAAPAALGGADGEGDEWRSRCSWRGSSAGWPTARRCCTPRSASSWPRAAAS
jgi:simple sugar transport system permease protein